MSEEIINLGKTALAEKIKKRYAAVIVNGKVTLPLECLIRIAMETIGEQESYIQELETKVQSYQANPEQVREMEREAMAVTVQTRQVKKLMGRLQKQGDRIHKLRQARNEMAWEICRLKKMIEHQSSD